MYDTTSTRFICKICGGTFEDQYILNQHIADFHHPKRTVTINDMVKKEAASVYAITTFGPKLSFQNKIKATKAKMKELMLAHNNQIIS